MDGRAGAERRFPHSNAVHPATRIRYARETMPPLLLGCSLTCKSPFLAATRCTRQCKYRKKTATFMLGFGRIAGGASFLEIRFGRVAASCGDMHVRLQPSSRGGRRVSRASRVLVSGRVAASYEDMPARSQPNSGGGCRFSWYRFGE